MKTITCDGCDETLDAKNHSLVMLSQVRGGADLCGPTTRWELCEACQARLITAMSRPTADAK